jgi:holliday junction DNA helicase RuvA
LRRSTFWREPERIERLWDNTRYFQGELRRLGFNMGGVTTPATETPITPVIIGDGRKTMEFSRALFDEGVLGTGIAFPTVPEGKARIRLMLTSEHTKAQLDRRWRRWSGWRSGWGSYRRRKHDCSFAGKADLQATGAGHCGGRGVGYDVTISVPTFTALPSVGLEAALHIHTQVSEDQIALFGFLDREEKRLFERLITVSGVGPKLAIKILSGLSSERTVQAIRGQDHAQLTRIPGVGKKLAERLVVELKDKLDDFAVAPVQTSVRGAAVDDVLSALTNLGYQRPAAEKAIEQAVAKGCCAGGDFDGLFRGALKVIR